jgi:hypothetical protein
MHSAKLILLKCIIAIQFLWLYGYYSEVEEMERSEAYLKNSLRV